MDCFAHSGLAMTGHSEFAMTGVFRGCNDEGRIIARNAMTGGMPGCNDEGSVIARNAMTRRSTGAFA